MCWKCTSSLSLYALYSDLAGDSEGCVAMYEFGNVVPLFPPTKTSTGGSVSRIRYTPHGNKFAVSDVQGNIFMWKGTQGTPKPYTVSFYQCF